MYLTPDHDCMLNHTWHKILNTQYILKTFLLQLSHIWHNKNTELSMARNNKIIHNAILLACAGTCNTVALKDLAIQPQMLNV